MLTLEVMSFYKLLNDNKETTTSYGVGYDEADNMYIVEKKYNVLARQSFSKAYEFPIDIEGNVSKDFAWAPWHEVPALGTCLGSCHVVENPWLESSTTFEWKV